MNKYIYIVLLSISSLAYLGCTDFLSEKTDGQIVGNGVLATQTGLESALTGAYQGLGSTWNYGFRNGWPTEMTLGGDDLGCPPGTGNTDEYDRLMVKNTNSSSASTFPGCYKTIQGANNVINNYENTKGDSVTIRTIAGEAYFLRAISYFWLVRCYGEIPLILTADYSNDLLSVSKSTVAEVYAQIESDLGKAEQMLSNKKRDDGRPNIGTAKAYLAEVYLTEAGWPLKETSKYALAAQKAKEVIDNRINYGFDMESSFAELYKNDETNLKISPEMEFVLPCIKDGTGNDNCMYGFWSYPGELGGWDVVFSELKFFHDFPAGVRKDATFATKVTKTDGTILDWTQLKYKRPYYKKLMKNENVAGYYSYNSALPIPMLRYTQTLLTYAEAKARSGGPDALAYTCLNAIRARAGLPNYPAMSAQAFADSTVNERAWELCGERVRWFDMVRLEIVASVFAHRDPQDNQPLSPTITPEQYTFPIPQHDALINPNL